MRRDIVLRGIVEHDAPDSWFAICLELNLYARAATAQQAHARLFEEIDRYLKEAYTVDRDHFSDLVPRRAPARFWLKYFAADWLSE